MMGINGKRAQHGSRREAPFRIQQARCDHHVAYDAGVILGHS